MTTTTPRRTAFAVTAALTAVVAVAGCTRNEVAAPTSPPAATATASESTTPPSVTSSTTTTTTAPVPVDGTITRAPSELTSALLNTDSFVAGIHVVPSPTGGSSSGGSGSGGNTVTSSDPNCAAFVTGSGSGGPAGVPGVTGHADIAFQDDADPMPFLFEQITTVGTTTHVAEVLAAVDASTRGCPAITMKVPGAAPSTMSVTSVTPPSHGDHATAVRLVGTSGPLRGLHITLVFTGVVDAVLSLMFIQAIESDIEGITGEAVARATAVFTYVKPS